MARMRHPNVIQFMGLCNEASHRCIVMEFAKRGSLSVLLYDKGVKLKVPEQVKIARDVASGLQYLHSLVPKVVHRDIKSMNVLLDTNGTAKLTDFGLSRVKTETLTATNSVGTIQWAAPEQLTGQRCTDKVDVYSYGMLVYELVSNEYPFGSKANPVQLLGQITQGKRRPAIPDGCHEGLKQLIEDCWQHEPTARPPFSDVLARLDRMAAEPTMWQDLIPLQWDFQPGYEN